MSVNTSGTVLDEHRKVTGLQSHLQSHQSKSNNIQQCNVVVKSMDISSRSSICGDIIKILSK